MMKPSIGTLTSKGQVTLPKKVRDFLGADTGTRLLFSEEPANQRVYIEVLDAKNTCPACEGTGNLGEDPCFICVQKGVIPSPFYPTEYFSLWLETYDIQISFSLETTKRSTGSVLLPHLTLTSSDLSKNQLTYLTDLLMYYLFIEFVVNRQEQWRTYIPDFQHSINTAEWKKNLINLQGVYS